MLMPNKVTKPIDSLIVISGHILSIIKNKRVLSTQIPI